MSGRRWVAALGALGALGGMTAWATTLGGLRIDTLGAGATAVVPCDHDGVAMSYLNEFDITTETYRTIEVALGDVDPACDGLAFRLTLASATANLRELTGAIQLNGTTRHTVALSPPIDSASITRAALVVTG